MKFETLPLTIRLAISPFRILIYLSCLIIAIFLEASAEHDKAEKLMDWATR